MLPVKTTYQYRASRGHRKIMNVFCAFLFLVIVACWFRDQHVIAGLPTSFQTTYEMIAIARNRFPNDIDKRVIVVFVFSVFIRWTTTEVVLTLTPWEVRLRSAWRTRRIPMDDIAGWRIHVDEHGRRSIVIESRSDFDRPIVVPTDLKLDRNFHEWIDSLRDLDEVTEESLEDRATNADLHRKRLPPS